MKKVLVAMSGGVDSSVSAFLLKKQGYEVCGVTMCLGVKIDDNSRPRCCGLSAIEDARRVADKLGIDHYVWDFSVDLEEFVAKKFIEEYKKGRTPNPCVECNRYLKFGKLLHQALNMGFDYLATGHYAKVENRNGRNFLLRPRDRVKDQTYFLYPVKKEYLSAIIFPLGDYTKEEVREIAHREGIPVYAKPQSQDICFIQDDYRSFVKKFIKDKPGDIIDKEGNILGRHKGITAYTIGQREGLGISFKHPLYVIDIKPEENKIVVGGKEDLLSSALIAGEINILVDDLPPTAYAKIRYSANFAKCRLQLLDDRYLKVSFEEKQTAVTPGQSVVLYDGDVVLGGGIIQKVIK